MILANNIHLIRKWLRDSQEQFGSRFGVSRTAIAKWETGANEPPLSAVIALEELSGVPVIRLFKERLGMEELDLTKNTILQEPFGSDPYSRKTNGTEDSTGSDDLLEILTSMRSMMEADREATAQERTENAEMRKRLQFLEKKIEMLDQEIVRLSTRRK